MTDDRTCVAIVPMFADLTFPEQLEVAGFARPLRLKRGEQIYRAGEASGQLLVVHKGRVKLGHVAESGQEQLLRVLEPGDFIGESAFVTGARPDHTATALSDVVLCAFSHDDLRELVQTFPDIAVRMLHAVTVRLVESERLIADMSTRDVQARIAGYLLDLPVDRESAQPGTWVRLPLAKNTIASLLGTTAETFSRRLASFARDGLITIDGPRIEIVDFDGLEQRTSA